MDKAICGTVVLVTEAGTKIGRAVALAFAREGCPLALCDGSEQGLSETVAQVRAAGSEPSGMICSMTDPAAMDRFVQGAADLHGGVDLLVNIVGNVDDLVTPTEETQFIDEDWLSLYTMNVMSAMRAIDLAIPLMRSRKGGRIINIYAEPEADSGGRLLAVASKAALLGLTRRLSRQYADENIHISMITPATLGGTLLEGMLLGEARRHGEALEGHVRRFLTDLRQFVELGRRTTPEEVARAVLLLSAMKPSSLGGASIRVDGDAVASMP
jgi:NAD(P)-dependent dehydrogenase (short-subunit alcohol dehydrogenase family)